MVNLINPEHPLKEYAEEVEPAIRQCLFCKEIAPNNIQTSDMIIRKTAWNSGWYSNAGLNLKTRQIARFYLCPHHRYMTDEAWEWVREGWAKT
jgi:hypothetical protein